jgi:hypothetical protein
MSDDIPAVLRHIDGVPAEDGEVVLVLTPEEAAVVRDVLARVAGDGRADVARRVFQVLEAAIGYDCLRDDGLDGEIIGAVPR